MVRSNAAHQPSSWKRWAGACVLTLVALVTAGCDRDRFQFTQDTPQEVLDAAKRMVLEGHAELLTELVFAEDERIRKLYRGLGGVLGSLEDLALQLAESFPTQVDSVRAEAQKAAAEGKSSSMLGAVLTGRRQQRTDTQSRFEKSDDPFNDVTQAIISDPYGWVSTSAERLSLTPISDDTVAVLWDNMPIFPPFGLIIQQKDDDKWYVVFPTSLPMVRNLLPSSDEELDLWLALLGAVENSIEDLRKAVKRGEITSLDQAAQKLVEYVTPTAVMAFYAYGKWKSEQEKEKAAERAAKGETASKRRQRPQPAAPPPEPAPPAAPEPAQPAVDNTPPSSSEPAPSEPASGHPEVPPPSPRLRSSLR
ncbi:MAG: hypothetical protein IT439_04465 [Phycisphaerales bacterium]|nr:hypothetical protein [Phycisphaerales bacterium]